MDEVRLVQKIGICAMRPGKNTSKPGKGTRYRISSYRLCILAIMEPNYVWCTDFTSIRTKCGFLYVVAILDWVSTPVSNFLFSPTVFFRFLMSIRSQRPHF
jgi:hypothetical protein